MTPHHKGKKVVCLHCRKELKGEETENHRCIWELLHQLAFEIARIKEDHCGNAGRNWLNGFNAEMEEVLNSFYQENLTE